MSRREQIQAELVTELRAELIARRRRRATQEGGPEPSVDAELEAVVEDSAALLSAETREQLCGLVRRETVGLGPLEELLCDPAVEEVLVNGHEEVWVERAGRLESTGIRFESDQHLRDVIERVLGPIGRRVDELSPMADGRLPDGSRVNAVIPPLAVDGPALSIRRFSALRPGPEALVESGSLPASLMERLKSLVGARRNLLISGGTGSGKTTVLNALSSFIEAGERVITIEDAAELRLELPHVVRLESRPRSVEGSGEVTIRELLRNALRMRPDRIVIGEVRGGEAMDLIAALNTGHSGALSTVHANSPADALRRVEMLAMMSGLDVPHEVVRDQLLGAVDYVLHLQRAAGGARHAVQLSEISGRAGGVALREVWSREGGVAGATE